MRALLVVVAALAVAAPASAGGWATAGLAPPDAGIGAGETWEAEVTILQHGQTPLPGVKPEVIIRNGEGDERRFAAKPTDEPGVYVAKVRFPTAGTWRYFVYDGFTQYGGAKTHRFSAVRVGASTESSSMALWPFGVAGAVPLAAGALFLLRRRRAA